MPSWDVRVSYFLGSALVPVPSFSSVGAASKYTKVEPLSLRERLARINTHTLSKKTTRLSQLLKQEAGLVPRVSNGLEEGLHASHPKGQDGAVVRWSLRLLSEMRRLRPERGRVCTLTCFFCLKFAGFLKIFLLWTIFKVFV